LDNAFFVSKFFFLVNLMIAAQIAAPALMQKTRAFGRAPNDSIATRQQNQELDGTPEPETAIPPSHCRQVAIIKCDPHFASRGAGSVSFGNAGG
jgi:hypothetical protein